MWALAPKLIYSGAGIAPPVWPDLATFHHFGKILKALGILYPFLLLAKFWNYFGNLIISLGKFSLLWMADIKQIIWQSGHNAYLLVLKCSMQRRISFAIWCPNTYVSAIGRYINPQRKLQCNHSKSFGYETFGAHICWNKALWLLWNRLQFDVKTNPFLSPSFNNIHNFVALLNASCNLCQNKFNSLAVNSSRSKNKRWKQ